MTKKRYTMEDLTKGWSAEHLAEVEAMTNELRQEISKSCQKMPLPESPFNAF